MHADRTNRALLGLLGLLLLAAGVAGILAGTSAFGAGGPHRHLLDNAAGRYTLAAGAVTDALTQEIETYRGVRAAHARMVGHPGRPRLAVTVDTDHDADLAALRHRIASGA